MTAAPPAAALDLCDRPTVSPPIWPTVIGTLSILSGAWGIVESAPGAFMSAWSTAGELWAGNFSLRSVLGLHAVGSAAWTGQYLVGILAGILLLRGRRGAVVLHWAFAVVAVVAVTLMALGFGGFVQLMGTSPGNLIITTCSMGASWLVDLAYPLFAFIWFCRTSVRRRVRAWRTPAGRAASAPAEAIWPTVLGIAALVLGGAALLHALTFLLGGITRVVMVGRFPAPIGGSVIRWTDLPVRALLVAAGWLLLRRRWAGVVCALVYAVYSLLDVGTKSAFVIRFYEANQASDRAMTPWLLVQSFQLISLLAPAVFLIVWFARPRIRAEVRSWGAGRPEAQRPPGGLDTPE